MNTKSKTLSLSKFEELFKTHFVELTGFSQSFVHDKDAAQEVVQNVFIKFWEKREDINLEQSLKSYLYTSVRNRSLNYLRDNKKYRSEILDEQTTEYNSGLETDHLVNDELQRKIEDAIELLPEKCRQVFEMSRFEGLKYKEIAEKMNISIKTVENQISKALKILREELKDYTVILILISFFE